MKNNKCVIHGGWAYFLLAARFAGVAPVNIKQFSPDCYGVSVSPNYAIYSIILLTLINCAAIIGVLINFTASEIRIDFRLTVFWVSHNIIFTSIIALIGSYKGTRRMKNLIEHLSVLETIESNIYLDSVIQTKAIGISKKVLLLNVITYCFITLHSLIGYTVLMLIRVPSPFLFFIHEFVYIAKLFIELQLMYLALKTFVAFKFLNQGLAGMLHLTVSAKKREIRRNIRTLTKSYVSICDVALKVNKEDGFIMFLVVVDNMHSLIIDGYYFFRSVPETGDSHSWFKDLSLVTCIFQIVKLLLFIENYHRIFKEAINTREILSKLIYHFTGVGQRMSIDLELLFKQLILNTPQYSPLGIFSLRRSNIITIFSVVSTCAVYLVQINSVKQ